MDLQTCPHCGVRVVRTDEGTCPSCRRPLADGEGAIGTSAPIAVHTAPGGRSIQPLIIGILLLILAAIGVSNSVDVMVTPGEPVQGLENQPELQAAVERGRAVRAATGSPLILVMYLVMLAGAAAMISRQFWGLALAAAVIGMIPCSPTFCLGLPIGIWALVVLNLRGIKTSFRS